MSPLCATLLVIAGCATIRAEHASGITGVIADPAQAVIPGGRVTLIGEAAVGNFETVADPNGRFRFSGISPGNYTLSISMPGFEDEQINGVRLGEGAVLSLPTIVMKVKNPFPYGCGGDVFALPLISGQSLRSGLTEVAGRIAESAATGGIEGVKVTIAAPFTRKAVATTHTDKQGVFRISNLKPGAYSLTAHLNGFADFVIDKFVVQSGQRSNIQTLEVHPCPIEIDCKATKRIRSTAICL